MEEKKEIKVRLSTVIYLTIIIALVVTLGVMYYFGFVANKRENIEEENVVNTTENIVSNADKEENFSEYKKYEGTWRLKDGEIYDSGAYDEEVKLLYLDKDKFTIQYSIYRITNCFVENAKIIDNTITCKLTEDRDDTSYIDVTIELKENELILNINKSNSDYIEKGKKEFVRKEIVTISQEEAEKIAMDYYKNVLDIRQDYLTYIKLNNHGVATNYDEFENKLDKVFTNDGKNKFISEYLGLLKIEDGKAYIENGDNPIAERKLSYNIKKVTIEENSIFAEFELTQKEIAFDDNIVYKYNEKLQLNRINDKWLIYEYSSYNVEN